MWWAARYRRGWAGRQGVRQLGRQGVEGWVGRQGVGGRVMVGWQARRGLNSFKTSQLCLHLHNLNCPQRKNQQVNIGRSFRSNSWSRAPGCGKTPDRQYLEAIYCYTHCFPSFKEGLLQFAISATEYQDLSDFFLSKHKML